MQFLDIKNVGPLTSIQLDVRRFNVFIGAQSIGKSTIAKILSTCCWIEKEVLTTINKEAVPDGHTFKNLLEDFHKMDGYIDVNSSSYIKYETECIIILYENHELKIQLKNDADYHRQKICYIPAERNMATLPELQNYEFGETNIRSFLFDWYNAREYYSSNNKADVMNLGVRYYYNKEEKKYKDRIEHQNGHSYGISLACASSGLQSLVPLLIMLDYYSGKYYDTFNDKKSFELDDKAIQLRRRLTEKMVLEQYKPGYSQEERGILMKEVNEKVHNGDEYVLKLLENYFKTVERLSTPFKTTFIIEEPEQNLFPDTQLDLIETLTMLCQQERKHHFTLTTHSPYIVNFLNVLLRRNKDNSRSYIDAEDLGVYLVSEGKLQDLKMQDMDTGEWVVDTMGLSEQMEDIYNEYQTLGA